MKPIESQALGLQDGQTLREGQGFDAGGLQFEAATGRAVRLGEHGSNLMARINQGFKGLSGKFWSTSKNKAHERAGG